MFLLRNLELFPLSRLDTIKIEDVLKNSTDRSVWIDFSGYMNTTMRSDYFDECGLSASFFPLILAVSMVDRLLLPRSVEVQAVKELRDRNYLGHFFFQKEAGLPTIA